ncbi:response regulator [Mucilaginibacter terrae]|uniref:Two-component system cell cycle response regulator DivK n=1 Tax=Mucilaginibacter terrae TaxID=1955052 RepID=A0ABU3GWG2_9SPHI|nr:response regulator [Mucilaginibacter terrae]MDT3404103.1 two-component system cell cycle response regulator DivK [Mucilaginibacter terrae]
MQKRILLLDNDGDLLRLADDMMYYGYSDVHITSDSHSVYSIAKNYKPDLIILDFLLIEERDASICETFKHDEEFKDVPVILISAYQNKKIDLESFSHDALFMKPLDTEKLASAINYLVAS